MGQLDSLQIMAGVDIPIDELNFTLHQPTMKEIAVMGETDYFLGLSIFKMSVDTLKVPSKEITNWMVFNEAITQKISGVENTQKIVTRFIQLFIKDAKFMIGPRSIMLQTPDGMKHIEPEQFDDFREYILQVGGESLLGDKKNEFNPGSALAAKIAEKMKRGRERVAEKKNAGKPKSTEGFLAKYMRSVATVTANTLGDVCQMTLLQLNDILQTYLVWESYDLDVRSRLAGAKNDSKLEHWMSRSLTGESDMPTV